MCDDAASVTADYDPETSTYAVRIGLPTFEVQVLIPIADVEKLGQVDTASWDDRGSVRIGGVLGTQAFWCTNPNTSEASILVGHDDETWDLCLVLPVGTVKAIVEAIAQAARTDD